jgi:hypothetical protein
LSRLRLRGRPPIALTEIEDRRGHWLLREAASALEVATYSGADMKEALCGLLADLGHKIYLEPSNDVRCLLVHALCREMQQDE